MKAKKASLNVRIPLEKKEKLKQQAANCEVTLEMYMTGLIDYCLAEGLEVRPMVAGHPK